MNLLLSAVLVAQVLSALGVIVLVLLQHGKGADMGAAFGSGSSGSLFGASGSANFLSRLTAGLAVIFFACTLVLAFVSQKPSGLSGGSVMDQPASSATPGAEKSEAAKSAAGGSAPTVTKEGGAASDSAKGEVPKSGDSKPEAAKSGSGSDIPK